MRSVIQRLSFGDTSVAKPLPLGTRLFRSQRLPLGNNLLPSFSHLGLGSSVASVSYLEPLPISLSYLGLGSSTTSVSYLGLGSSIANVSHLEMPFLPRLSHMGLGSSATIVSHLEIPLLPSLFHLRL
ncbi:hypothetical protein Fot_42070 [Forsythia ovata]|uniref:Uncharacterized protein n=1 Tax=Forsythia ovata TaxID=205694 RepID=A0ABD1RK47_9LAMI